MNQDKPVVPDQLDHPMPQKYLERIIKIAGQVWSGKKEVMLVSRDQERRGKLFIKGYGK